MATGIDKFQFMSLTFIEMTYSVVTLCLLATIAVVQEVYFIAKGQEVLS